MKARATVAALSGVTLTYGKTIALDGIDLAIPSGCMAGFIGADGVGKSSLLSLVTGARRIQSGQVTVLGGDMADARHRRAVCPKIAYMPQGLGRNLYADLSVAENIEFFGRLFGQDAAERAIEDATCFWKARVSRLSPTGRRKSSPAACGKNSVSAARSFTIPIFSFSTSRRRASIRCRGGSSGT